MRPPTWDATAQGPRSTLDPSVSVSNLYVGHRGMSVQVQVGHECTGTSRTCTCTLMYRYYVHRGMYLYTHAPMSYLYLYTHAPMSYLYLYTHAPMSYLYLYTRAPMYLYLYTRAPMCTCTCTLVPLCPTCTCTLMPL